MYGDPVTLARITVSRPLEWMDTDAAGIWHHSTAIRFIEHAELVLHQQLGVVDMTFGATPRVRFEIDFSSPVRFGDDVATTIAVATVGRTSVTYEFTLDGPRGQVAKGLMVTVVIDDEGRAQEVPAALRDALLQGGDQADAGGVSG